jgi:hypothetical protein
MDSILRSELYERVWREPIIRIASDLGTTNFLISELCRKHGIPTPPAGHWTKVDLGKPVTVSELPPGPDVEISLTRLARPGYRASKPISRAERREARAVAEAPVPVVVPEHPKVRKTIEALQSGKPGQPRTSSGKGRFWVSVSDELIDRTQALLSGLLAEQEGRGGAVSQGDNALEFVVGSHRVSFSVIEKLNRKPHVLTDTEKAELERYEAKFAKRASSWRYDAPKFPTHDYLPTGKLSLILDDKVSYRGIRKTYSDRVALKVEMMTVEIVDALFAYAKAEDDWLEDLRLQRERAAEAERQAALQRKRVALEGRRLEFVERQLARLDQAEKLERLLSVLPTDGEGAEYQAFLAWSADHARRLRASLTPSVINAKLAATKLMHDGAVLDDWYDVETGDWRSRK